MEIAEGRNAEDEAEQARGFAQALRNPVERALCFVSAGLQTVLGALGRVLTRVTGG